MSWLTNFVRPKLRALVNRVRETRQNLWIKCPNCGAMLFHRELESNLNVCTHCQHHMRLEANKRAAIMLDSGYETIDWPVPPIDPLKFRDRKRYTERLKEAQSVAPSHGQDALLVASGTINRFPAVVVVFEFNFMAGSMGVAVGNGIVAAAENAVQRRAALVIIPASGGARMQEGALSLMQLPRTVIAINRLKRAGLPYLVVLTNPTTGGVSASFAMLGDVTLAEPGATIGFAGARVIEETIKEKLPEGFQRAEYLLEHGMIDAVVHRAELKATLSRILSVLSRSDPREKASDAPLQLIDSRPGESVFGAISHDNIQLAAQ